MDDPRLTALDRAMVFCEQNDVTDVDDMLAIAAKIDKFLSPPSDTTEK